MRSTTALGVLTMMATIAMPLTLAAQEASNPVSTSIRAQYQLVKTNVVAAAEQMPEEQYGFQATDDVRTFGEIIGHLAFAQFNICSGLRGEANPQSGNPEQTMHTKAELVAVLQDAFAYCDPVYAHATDATMGDEVAFFGGTAVRHYPMTFALIHAYEHYGNIVTYMRLNDMVPPSSQGG